MPAKGTITERKRFWLGVYARARARLGNDAKQDAVLEWVENDPQARALWEEEGYELPADSTAKGYLTQLSARGGDAVLDEPWSIGSLPDRGANAPGIPSGALPFVLAVWIRALVGGKQLTNREALWVARLQHLVPEGPLGLEGRLKVLYSCAVVYSAEEKVALALREPADTTGIDAVLAFNVAFGWTLDGSEAMAEAYRVALEMGLVPNMPTREGVGVREWETDRPDVLKLAELVQAADIEERRIHHETGWWNVPPILLGLRKVSQTAEWNGWTDEERLSFVKKVRRAAMSKSWNEYRRLVGVQVAQGSEVATDAST